MILQPVHNQSHSCYPSNTQLKFVAKGIIGVGVIALVAGSIFFSPSIYGKIIGRILLRKLALPLIISGITITLIGTVALIRLRRMPNPIINTSIMPNQGSEPIRIPPLEPSRISPSLANFEIQTIPKDSNEASKQALLEKLEAWKILIIDKMQRFREQEENTDRAKRDIEYPPADYSPNLLFMRCMETELQSAIRHKSETLQSNLDMILNVINNLTNTNLHDHHEEWNHITICRLDDTIQAIALYNEAGEKIKLNYIATHPDNMAHVINPSGNQVRGAGTAIMTNLIARAAIQANGFIYLDAVSCAQQFYLRLGFTWDHSVRGGLGVHPMKLSTEKIRELVNENPTAYLFL